ncbi:MAG: UbiA family prenyltransferase [bacterium]
MLRGWLELIRPPNLFTVPGDILAGVFLAVLDRDKLLFLPLLITVSLFLYTAGLILNDYCDRGLDMVERPKRPLPSGRVSPQSALAAALVLIGIALVLALGYPIRPAFWLACGLVVLIFLYNGPGRKIPWLGFITMGLCRGGNVLLGASLGRNPFSGPVLAGAGVETMYIVSISVLACHEIEGSPGFWPGWLPLLSLFSFPFLFLTTGISVMGALAALIAAGWIFSILRHFDSHGQRSVSEMVGKLIRSLILIQVALIALSIGRNHGHKGYLIMAMALCLMLLPVSGYMAGRFYGS